MRLSQRLFISTCIAFALAAAASSTVRAEVISLVCDDTNGTKAYFTIDSDKRYVKQQASDGTWSVWQQGMTVRNDAGRQVFVEIDQDFIKFGAIRIRDGSKTGEHKINRRTGVWTFNGEKPTRCSALPSQRQF
jgi:hypothetical protein